MNLGDWMSKKCAYCIAPASSWLSSVVKCSVSDSKLHIDDIKPGNVVSRARGASDIAS